MKPFNKERKGRISPQKASEVLLPSAKRFEEANASKSKQETLTIKKASPSKISRHSSFSENVTFSEEISSELSSIPKPLEPQYSNSKSANCFTIFHPWSEFPVLEKYKIAGQEPNLSLTIYNEIDKVSLNCVGNYEYSMSVKENMSKVYKVLSNIAQNSISDTFGFIIISHSEDKVRLLETLKILLGDNVTECVLLVTPLSHSLLGNGQTSLLYHYSVASNPSKIFFAGSFLELLKSAREFLSGTPLGKIEYKCSRIQRSVLALTRPKVLVTENLLSQIKFHLPAKACPSPLAALPAVAGGLASYNLAAELLSDLPSSALLLSGVGLLYTIARGVNYLASSYVKNKGIVHAVDLAKLHSPEIHGKNIRFHSASIVKGSSKVSWDSATCSFDAYNCAIINEGRDLLISMKYWIDQFAIHNYMKKIAYDTLQYKSEEEEGIELDKCKNAENTVFERILQNKNWD